MLRAAAASATRQRPVPIDFEKILAALAEGRVERGPRRGGGAAGPHAWSQLKPADRADQREDRTRLPALLVRESRSRSSRAASRAVSTPLLAELYGDAAEELRGRLAASSLPRERLLRGGHRSPALEAEKHALGHDPERTRRPARRATPRGCRRICRDATRRACRRSATGATPRRTELDAGPREARRVRRTSPWSGRSATDPACRHLVDESERRVRWSQSARGHPASARVPVSRGWTQSSSANAPGRSASPESPSRLQLVAGARPPRSGAKTIIDAEQLAR